MKILTVSLIVAGLLATTGIASADRRHHDRRDRWERNETRWHRPARRVVVAPVVRIAPPRVVVRHRHRVQPRVIVVQPAPPPPPVYVVQPYPPAPVYVPPPSNCDHDNDGYYDRAHDHEGYDDGYDDGYNNYSAPVQPSGVSVGGYVRVGS